ncbi:MAG TPA: M15 family metallopeptidase [Pyrinomonadaceae bacterium]|nr:M15 family metallopeptidase [Pyrinomonadaceae bacterium]
MKSYINKKFIVDNPDARIRKDADLLAFEVENNKPRLIPRNSEINVTDTQILNDQVFAKADGFGWTAANNLKNKFLNETLAAFEPPDGNEKGANAAWDSGNFLKQLTLFQIVGAGGRLDKFISSDVAEFYLALVNAAEKDGVLLPLKSGFRTYPKQESLYNGFIKKLPGFNLAAKPGFSNHQDGYAYDFEISAYEGNPRYDWLKAHGPAHGFVRTVNKEPWHWEYRPEVAKTGAYKTDRVKK